MQPYELRSLPDEKGASRLYLLQLPFKTDFSERSTKIITTATLEGASLQDARPLLVEMVGSADKLDTFLLSAGSMPVNEEQAVRMGLIFALIDGLRSESRTQKIIDGVRGIPVSLAAQMRDQIDKDTSEKKNVIKGLRTMFAGE